MRMAGRLFSIIQRLRSTEYRSATEDWIRKEVNLNYGTVYGLGDGIAAT